MMQFKIALVVGITFLSCGCDNTASIAHSNRIPSESALNSTDTQSIDDRAYPNTQLFPKEISSVAELGNIGNTRPVQMSADGQWCAIVWDDLNTSIGFAHAVVYKRNSSKWQQYWEGRYLLNPGIHSINGDIVISVQREWNINMWDMAFKSESVSISDCNDTIPKQPALTDADWETARQTIIAFMTALENQRYRIAWNYLGQGASPDNLNDHWGFKRVRLQSITKPNWADLFANIGEMWFEVEFDATIDPAFTLDDQDTLQVFVPGRRYYGWRNGKNHSCFGVFKESDGQWHLNAFTGGPLIPGGIRHRNNGQLGAAAGAE